MRLMLSCVRATRLPKVMVIAARMTMASTQSALSGASASTKRRRMSAKAATFGPTER